MADKNLITFNGIQNLIHSINGLQVMMDSDLADLYRVGTKILNQAVKRNIERFPFEFMFQLSTDEHDSLRSQFVTLNKNEQLKAQVVTSNTGRGRHRKYLPYVFTEQGVAMLAGGSL